MHSSAWDACFQLLQWDRQPGLDGRRGIGYKLLQRGQADAYKAPGTSPVWFQLRPQTLKAERIALQAACQSGNSNQAGSEARSMGYSLAVHLRSYPWASAAGTEAAFQGAHQALVISSGPGWRQPDF
jgi:hypothetical protein